MHLMMEIMQSLTLRFTFCVHRFYGVERRILDWLDRNVAGVSGFREGRSENKWENLQQLYNDLKRNQTTSTVPYFFSQKETKNFWNSLSILRPVQRETGKQNPAAVSAGGRYLVEQRQKHKSNKSKINSSEIRKPRGKSSSLQS